MRSWPISTTRRPRSFSSSTGWWVAPTASCALPKRRARTACNNSTSADIIQAVRQLVLIASCDDLICRPPQPVATGLQDRQRPYRWTRERGRINALELPPSRCSSPPMMGWNPGSTLGNAAKLLKIAPKTLRLAAEAGEIEAFHPLSDGPWIFARASLITTAAQSIAERARQNPRYPTGSHPNQQSLFSSTT